MVPSRLDRCLVPALLALLASCPALAQYSGGSGTAEDPYQIATAADLILLGETPEDYDKHFIMTADIDLAPNLPGRKVFDRAVIAPDTELTTSDVFSYHEYGGSPFIGVFDGGGYTISHMVIRGGSYLGLFGQLAAEAVVSNVGLLGVNIRGTYCIGGLVGRSSAVIFRCSSDGIVTGSGNSIGGLIGLDDGGTISQCYSRCDVTATRDEAYGFGGCGGLVGVLGGDVVLCYSSGTVTGDYYVGGLVGLNGGQLLHSFSVCPVSGRSVVGGLVGMCGFTKNCYSTGAVVGDSVVGGLVGSIGWISIDPEGRAGGCGTIVNSFWDIETSGQTKSPSGSTGLTTVQMEDRQTFMNAGWDFLDVLKVQMLVS